MGRGPGREDRGGRGARTGEGIGASKGCGQKREHWGRKDCSEPRVPPRPMPGSHLGKKLCKKGEGGWLGERPARQRTRAGGLAWEARASHKGLRTKVSEGRSRTPADRRCTSPEHTEECPESLGCPGWRGPSRSRVWGKRQGSLSLGALSTLTHTPRLTTHQDAGVTAFDGGRGGDSSSGGSPRGPMGGAEDGGHMEEAE